jgi:hypothetical protein
MDITGKKKEREREEDNFLSITIFKYFLQLF